MFQNLFVSSSQIPSRLHQIESSAHLIRGDLGYSKVHMIVDRLSNSYTLIPPSPCWTTFLVRLTRRTFAIEPDVSEKIDALVDGHTLEANLLVNKALRH